MNGRTIALAASLVLLAFASPHLADLSPVGEASAASCNGLHVICCPVNSFETGDNIFEDCYGIDDPTDDP